MSYGKFASILAVLSTFGGLLAGCGTDCRLVCEEQEKADCYNAPSDARDCERECKHTQDLVTNADCQEDYDAYLVCIDDLENVCDAYPEPCETGKDCDEPECDDENEDLTDCILDYCLEHPRNNECEELIGKPI